VRELPRACDTQDGELDERPAHDAGVGGFGLIAEFGFTLLFSPLAYLQKLSLSPPSQEDVGDIKKDKKRTETYTLKQLLPLNIHQPPIQILHLLHQIRNLAMVIRLDLRGRADGQIERQLDAAERLAAEPAGVAGGVRGGEADAVVAGVGGGEGYLAAGLAAAGDDAVVVVEDFLGGCKTGVFP
jgi:hypothetical protein